MANWQNLLKLDKEEQELLDSLPPEVRRTMEARMKDRDSTKSEEEVKYMLQIEEIVNDPKVKSMRNELESMKEKMNDKATELMGYMWNNDKNPIDADDREDDRYGPGYKAGEKLGDIIEEEIQREFGGYKPW